MNCATWYTESCLLLRRKGIPEVIAKTDYAYATTAVRVREMTLLSPADLERMADILSVEEVMEFLRGRNWNVPADKPNIASLLRSELVASWNFLVEVAPDIRTLYPLILRKDYHNLKAAIKSNLAGVELDKYFLSPGTVSRDLITEAVKTRNYSLLPPPMNMVGEEAYDVLVRTGDGQLADIIIDRAALDEILKAARLTGNELLIRLQELFCSAADIKTAFRSARMRKSLDFLERAISSEAIPDRAQMIEAAAKSESALLAWLRQAGYAESAVYLEKSPASFEKWCDDRAVAMIEDVKYIFFGPEPLIAYFLAKEAEIKNVRILLTAIENQLPFEHVNERLRRMNV